MDMRAYESSACVNITGDSRNGEDGNGISRTDVRRIDVSRTVISRTGVSVTDVIRTGVGRNGFIRYGNIRKGTIGNGIIRPGVSRNGVIRTGVFKNGVSRIIISLTQLMPGEDQHLHLVKGLGRGASHHVRGPLHVSQAPVGEGAGAGEGAIGYLLLGGPPLLSYMPSSWS